MNKYYVILENEKKVGDAKVIFEFRNIKYGQVDSDKFYIYCTQEDKVHMVKTFEWMSLIRVIDSEEL